MLAKDLRCPKYH